MYSLFDNWIELEAAARKLQKLGVEQTRVVDETRLENKITLIPGLAVVQIPDGAGGASILSL
jgi:hypothetical protein